MIINSKYVSGSILNEEYTLNIDKLVNIISNLKWNYYEQYHQEPRFIKMPIWVYVLLQQFTRQINGFYERIENGETIPMYMGLQICDTISISKIEDIEVF